MALVNRDQQSGLPSSAHKVYDGELENLISTIMDSNFKLVLLRLNGSTSTEHQESENLNNNPSARKPLYYKAQTKDIDALYSAEDFIDRDPRNDIYPMFEYMGKPKVVSTNESEIAKDNESFFTTQPDVNANTRESSLSITDKQTSNSGRSQGSSGGWMELYLESTQRDGNIDNLDEDQWNDILEHRVSLRSSTPVSQSDDDERAEAYLEENPSVLPQSLMEALRITKEHVVNHLKGFPREENSFFLMQQRIHCEEFFETVGPEALEHLYNVKVSEIIPERNSSRFLDFFANRQKAPIYKDERNKVGPTYDPDLKFNTLEKLQKAIIEDGINRNAERALNEARTLLASCFTRKPPEFPPESYKILQASSVSKWLQDDSFNHHVGNSAFAHFTHGLSSHVSELTSAERIGTNVGLKDLLGDEANTRETCFRPIGTTGEEVNYPNGSTFPLNGLRRQEPRYIFGDNEQRFLENRMAADVEQKRAFLNHKIVALLEDIKQDLQKVWDVVDAEVRNITNVMESEHRPAHIETPSNTPPTIESIWKSVNVLEPCSNRGLEALLRVKREPSHYSSAEELLLEIDQVVQAQMEQESAQKSPLFENGTTAVTNGNPKLENFCSNIAADMSQLFDGLDNTHDRIMWDVLTENLEEWFETKKTCAEKEEEKEEDKEEKKEDKEDELLATPLLVLTSENSSSLNEDADSNDEENALRIIETDDDAEAFADVEKAMRCLMQIQGSVRILFEPLERAEVIRGSTIDEITTRAYLLARYAEVKDDDSPLFDGCGGVHDRLMWSVLQERFLPIDSQ